ncbi:MAG: hypothetical protein KA132_02380, partial [Thauera sp.]|nr:hypothetical protein [Thauera sp.]
TIHDKHGAQCRFPFRTATTTKPAQVRCNPPAHSIINETRKSAWLKGFAMIEIGPYRRFYRLHRTPFAGAGDGAICGVTTLAAPSSIAF